MADLEREFVHLVRLALSGDAANVAALARKVLRHLTRARPELALELGGLLRDLYPVRAMKDAGAPLPVDSDSRLELLRRELSPVLDAEPIWPANVDKELKAVIAEREREDELRLAGIRPTRSLLFIGPPGVGKTLAARWLAVRLHLPLLSLDLAAVMSSFLGRTGNNIRAVLDFARTAPSVLLLDEFDAIAKRRDDSADIGELKRLVTVLLQSVDDWPTYGLLIAATNHPELLDPAVWRRFDRLVQFPPPDIEERRKLLLQLLGERHAGLEQQVEAIAATSAGRSFSDLARLAESAIRDSVVSGRPLQLILDELLAESLNGASLSARLAAASDLASRGYSQRQIASLAGVARDTIRKHISRTTSGGAAAKRGTR